MTQSEAGIASDQNLAISKPPACRTIGVSDVVQIAQPPCPSVVSASVPVPIQFPASGHASETHGRHLPVTAPLSTHHEAKPLKDVSQFPAAVHPARESNELAGSIFSNVRPNQFRTARH